LKEDNKAIFTAASQASKAADYLRQFSESSEEAA
jgi:antirestriction protein ArdC